MKKAKRVPRVKRVKAEPVTVVGPTNGGDVMCLPGTGANGGDNGRVVLQSANGKYSLIVDDDGIHQVKTFR